VVANLIYRAVETTLSFRDSGGDAVLTLQNLSAGAGRVSARYDRSTGSKPRLYEWRAVMQFNTAAVVGELVEIYLFESDGTYMDGTLGSSDAALGSDKRKNGKLIGVVVVDTTSTATDIVASGMCVINARYFSVGVWNGSAADPLQNTSNASRVNLTPVPDEVQA
jgi:hypothetical protein